MVELFVFYDFCKCDFICIVGDSSFPKIDWYNLYAVFGDGKQFFDTVENSYLSKQDLDKARNLAY